MIKQVGAWIVWFYCLKIWDAVKLLLICSLLFCLVREWLKSRKWWRWLCAAFLLASMAAVILVTVGNRGGGSEYQINLIPFHTYRYVMNGGHPDTYRSNFMNAALFLPAGLLFVSLLPEKWPAWCRCLLTVALLGAISASVEYAQYRYALGNVEIDDVIHNTAGALAGSLAVLMFSPVAGWIKEKLIQKMTDQ